MYIVDRSLDVGDVFVGDFNAILRFSRSRGAEKKGDEFFGS